jgi:hypothetical protein
MRIGVLTKAISAGLLIGMAAFHHDVTELN